MTKKKRIIILVVLVIAAVVAWRVISSRPEVDSGTVKVSGNFEVTDVRLSFKIQGRVLERRLGEGDPVSMGDIVALLDGSELRQITAQAEAALAVAQAEAARARLEYARQKELHDSQVISDRDYELAEAGNATAEAREKQAAAALELAKTRYDFTTLSSPVSGVVLSKHIEPGEYVLPGAPVVTVGVLEDTWLRAYITESDLGAVKIGQPVQVRTDAYPDKTYLGQVSFISPEAEFTPRTVQTPQERVKLVYRIKIDVPNTEMELKPGMPADADILVK